jgi:UDP-N-acetylglucosamine--dolichyl-phosphate N-acetylglucosaminephosphotransferase
MAIRRRPAAVAAQDAPQQPPAAAAASAGLYKELVLRPPNLVVVAVSMALFLAPFSYLALVHYPLGSDLRKSILICGGLSLVGFFVALGLIPVAARYLLRRRMFGCDINKRGLPTGEIQV